MLTRKFDPGTLWLPRPLQLDATEALYAGLCELSHSALRWGKMCPPFHAKFKVTVTLQFGHAHYISHLGGLSKSKLNSSPDFNFFKFV
jgi:hypothetical protein